MKLGHYLETYVIYNYNQFRFHSISIFHELTVVRLSSDFIGCSGVPALIIEILETLKNNFSQDSKVSRTQKVNISVEVFNR